MVISMLFLVLLAYISTLNNNNIPFELHKGLPVVEVVVNDKPARMIIDTGASSSVLDKESSVVYGYKCQMFDGLFSRGISGTSSIGLAKNVNMTINGKKIVLNFKCIDLNELSKTMNVLGVLGSDYFSRNSLIIDYDTLTMKHKL